VRITGWLVAFVAALASSVAMGVARPGLEPPMCDPSMSMVIDGGGGYATPIEALRAELERDPDLRSSGIDPAWLERTSGPDQAVQVDAGQGRTRWLIYRDGRLVWQADVLEDGNGFFVEAWALCNLR